ncbi:MAG: 23S rRNA (adenine(2503)-C(2))-methyltransferase RlmN, partial [Christensenellales bacterium]
LQDGNIVEGVTMRYNYGNTLCVSTQVGCRMGCKFCASTLEGCVRNLTPGELLGQIIAVNGHLHETDGPDARISNVVLMGSGEPLDNYDNVIKFLRLLNREDGLHMSLRGVSLSTCGLVPRIYDLANEGLPVTLCISLHAPNDEIRRRTMPIANKYAMDDILAACRNYIDKTGRRVIFEYALVSGVNCSRESAHELAARLRGMQCHVNLIPLNDVPERDLRAPYEGEMRAFEDELKHLHISVSRRREMGDDIEGACGQLRRAYIGSGAPDAGEGDAR